MHRVRQPQSWRGRNKESGEGIADRPDEAREEGDREQLQQIGTVCVEERGLRV